MRRRILAIVSAAVIAVLLLTGCSNGFKQASLVNVAKKNDLKQLTLTELEKFFDGESYSVGEPYENKFINSGYYVAKDSEEATYALKKHYRQDANDSIGLKDLALCGKDDVFFGIVMTAESEENANKLYFEWLDIMAKALPEPGTAINTKPVITNLFPGCTGQTILAFIPKEKPSLRLHTLLIQKRTAKIWKSSSSSLGLSRLSLQFDLPKYIFLPFFFVINL